MRVSVGYRDLKRLHKQRLNLIDGYISGYYYIPKSTEQLHIIKQENKLEFVLGYIESYCIGTK